MPENDPVKRMKAAARRGVGTGTVEEQRGWYLEELDQEIGRNPSGTWRSVTADDGRGNGIAGFIIALLLLASMTFAVTMAVLFWRDGRFDAYLPPMKTKSEG
jgi:hypothetical protein